MAATVIDNDDGGRCPFYRHRDACLLQVAQNPALSGGAVKVATALALEFYNREKFLAGDKFAAWPSMGRMADYLGVHDQTVKKGIKELEAQGHVLVRRPQTKGNGHHNAYALVVKPPVNGSEKTTNKTPDNGSEKTTIEGRDIGSQAATNKAANGSQMTSPMVAYSIHKPLEEPLDGAGARSRAPQAPEPDDGSDNERDQNHSQSDNGDLGTHERAPSPIPAAVLSQETASYLSTYTEADWEEIRKRDEGYDPTLQYEPAVGAVDSDHGQHPTGGIEFCQDDEFAWNPIAFHIFEKCEGIFDQDTEIDIRTTVVLLRIVEELRKFSPGQARDFGDAFVEAIRAPEHSAAAFRHIHWFAVGQTSKAGEVLAHLRRVVDDATRRRAKAMRQPEGSDMREVANGR